MAVTGTGTQADPFIVHSYSEFMTLSTSEHSGSATVYVKWFDEPNQVLDCNDYGSEFKWGSFENGSNGGYARYTIDIDLNGATIKNFIIAPGATMFKTYARGGITGSLGIINVRNGSLRNVFMGSATSCIALGAVNFQDVSLSVNVAGSTEIPFLGVDESGDSLWKVSMDNCALYLRASTLNASLIQYAEITDTDIEVYVSNVNQQIIFSNCTLTDCRLQGKISGTIKYYSNRNTILGNTSGSGSVANLICRMINCVVDVDFEGIRVSNTNYRAVAILYEMATGELNTNIFCNTHLPSDQEYMYPDNWHYISHSLMRNGAYLNSKGFTVVEVVEG